MTPAALLVHVPDIELGLDWYQRAFPTAKARFLPEFDFTVLDIGGFSLEIVQADDKVGSGKHGVVLYWLTQDWHATLKHFSDLGARLYRGPMAIENGLSMCQFEDPFGNLIGVRGRP
ncbi:glyoxalase/bleomycin resistance/dioxygenase family protein [Bacterioplanes sanyensis]|uniref:Glyoxalase/bleomycin resistance/dioxygenase family protein n=1 Tax=Bacterioplanes sanyensis TaxID=1249553 RepID=A0A222FJ83_9GAMM|nr:VOC family protein [Bacterioplanes sanyensis]ASP38554.1 glyoxalase/bleomycin resistance/dioxygenase family protein [Bacterioplanes sanyensis]